MSLHGYIGDLNPEEGGFWWQMDNASDDSAQVVEIVAASDMGGPSNLFFVEVGSLYLPGDEREARTMDSMGMGRLDEPQALAEYRVMAMHSHWGIDEAERHIIQIGANDSLWDNRGGFGMPAPEDIEFVGHRTRIGPMSSIVSCPGRLLTFNYNNSPELVSLT